MATARNLGPLSARLANASFKQSFDQKLKASNPQIIVWQPAAEKALGRKLITSAEFASVRDLINDGWTIEAAEYKVMGFTLTR